MRSNPRFLKLLTVPMTLGALSLSLTACNSPSHPAVDEQGRVDTGTSADLGTSRTATGQVGSQGFTDIRSVRAHDGPNPTQQLENEQRKPASIESKEFGVRPTATPTP